MLQEWMAAVSGDSLNTEEQTMLPTTNLRIKGMTDNHRRTAGHSTGHKVVKKGDFFLFLYRGRRRRRRTRCTGRTRLDARPALGLGMLGEVGQKVVRRLGREGVPRDAADQCRVGSGGIVVQQVVVIALRCGRRRTDLMPRKFLLLIILVIMAYPCHTEKN